MSSSLLWGKVKNTYVNFKMPPTSTCLPLNFDVWSSLWKYLHFLLSFLSFFSDNLETLQFSKTGQRDIL